jgi:hypothetical protein
VASTGKAIAHKRANAAAVPSMIQARGITGPDASGEGYFVSNCVKSRTFGPDCDLLSGLSVDKRSLFMFIQNRIGHIEAI